MKNFLRNFFKKEISVAEVQPITEEKPQKRSFAAAKIGRLTNDWVTSPIDANEDIRSNLSNMITRAADLSKNNPYFRKYLALREKNIVGPHGFKLQMKVMEYDGKRQDTLANKLIESAWIDFSKAANCSANGQQSLSDLLRLAVRTRGIYGECFIRVIEGFPGSKYGIVLQLLAPELCDIDYNVASKNIIMGIEHDDWGRPLAYYFKNSVNYGTRRVRIPASEIIHVFRREFPGQARGFPPGCASMATMNMFDGYQEAVLVNARVSACKMGFITPENGEYLPDDYDGDTQIKEASPGIFEKLPVGTKIQTFDPTQPTANHDSYTKTMLRAIGVGLDVAYSSMSNDLTDVNFSSIRSGVLDERDSWRFEQREVMDGILTPVFERWLPLSMLTGKINLPMAKLEKFKAASWIPRSFQWVDPKADVESQLLLLQNNLTAPQKIAAEQGEDLDDIYIQVSTAQDSANEAGISKPVSMSKTTPQADPVDKQPNNKKESAQ